MKSNHSAIKSAIVFCLTTLVAISAFVLIKGWASGSFRSMQTLRQYVASYGMWAPAILLLIQLFLTILPVCTSFTGCVVGAALFGAAGGFWINYIGICAGSIIAYALAKRFGAQLVNSMLSMKKYDDVIEKCNRSKYYPKFLFFAILLPMAPDNFLCYFSGLIKMPKKLFSAIILAAKPWCILFYSIFFARFI